MKLDALIQDLRSKRKDGGPLGRCKALVYTVEFQKRGLPHAHILMICEEDTIQQPADIDKYISAQLPPVDSPILNLIKKSMVHGPCEHRRCSVKDPVTKEHKGCKWGYPKAYNEETYIEENSFPVYRRPNDWRQERIKCGRGYRVVTNRDVVPFCPALWSKNT